MSLFIPEAIKTRDTSDFRFCTTDLSLLIMSKIPSFYICLTDFEPKRTLRDGSYEPTCSSFSLNKNIRINTYAYANGSLHKSILNIVAVVIVQQHQNRIAEQLLGRAFVIPSSHLIKNNIIQELTITPITPACIYPLVIRSTGTPPRYALPSDQKKDVISVIVLMEPILIPNVDNNWLGINSTTHK